MHINEAENTRQKAVLDIRDIDITAEVYRGER